MSTIRPCQEDTKKKHSSITCITLRCQRTCFSSPASTPIRKHQQSDSVPDCSVRIFDLRRSTSGVNHREHTNRTIYQSEASAEARRSLRLCDCQTAKWFWQLIPHPKGRRDKQGFSGKEIERTRICQALLLNTQVFTHQSTERQTHTRLIFNRQLSDLQLLKV